MADEDGLTTSQEQLHHMHHIPIIPLLLIKLESFRELLIIYSQMTLFNASFFLTNRLINGNKISVFNCDTNSHYISLYPLCIQAKYIKPPPAYI